MNTHNTTQIEHSLLWSSFLALARQMNLIFQKKLWFVMLEQFLMKYIWGMTGGWWVVHGGLVCEVTVL